MPVTSGTATGMNIENTQTEKSVSATSQVAIGQAASQSALHGQQEKADQNTTKCQSNIVNFNNQVSEH